MGHLAMDFIICKTEMLTDDEESLTYFGPSGVSTLYEGRLSSWLVISAGIVQFLLFTSCSLTFCPCVNS